MAKFKTQFDKKPVRDKHFPCDDYREGDGVDPRYETGSQKIFNRKAMQLCSQVAQILNFTFQSLGDEYLHNLYVEKVIPYPNSGQLLATLDVPKEFPISKVLEKLELVQNKLRREVANSISRKRVPQIKFNLK